MNDAFMYFVCGILSSANNPREWSNQAQVWVQDRGYCKLPGGFTYFDSVAGAPLNDDSQADDIAVDFADALDEGQSINAVGHSNGCRILLHVLKRHPRIRIDVLQLIAAADNPDCDANGLNDAVARGQVGKVVFYVSPIDEVLGLPVIGYGTLGKVGPHNMSDALKAITAIIEEPMKHSEWVSEKFEQTMRQIVAGDK